MMYDVLHITSNQILCRAGSVQEQRKTIFAIFVMKTPLATNDEKPKPE